jgi:hypothetical protein
VWVTEREDLAIWADQLQARGEPLGELIAISLRADEISRRRADADAAQVARLHTLALTLRLSLAEQLLGPGIGELPQLRLRWQHGVVRAIHLDRNDAAAPPAPDLVLEVLVDLLRRPALRFLDQLHLAALFPDDGSRFERELLRALAHPECIARPRRLVLGPMPRKFRRLLRWDAPPPELTCLPPAELTAAADHGLTWMIRWGRVQSLPWAAGDHGTRLQRLDRLLARPWLPAHARVLERSIWDTSAKVRRRIITALPELPDDMASAILAVLAVNLDGQRSFGDIVERSVTRIASARPSWVACATHNFSDDEAWVPRWLAGLGRRSRAAARLAIPRITGMLARPSGPSPGQRHGLLRALAAFGVSEHTIADAPLDDETIAELLHKIGAHRGTS